MAVVHPQAGRAVVVDAGAGLEIAIPAPRSIFALLFLPVWLTGWAFGEVAAVSGLWNGAAQGPGMLFMLVWLTAWTVGGAGALGVFLWMLRGRQLIRVAYGVCSLRWELFGLGVTRDYDAGHISGLRVAQEGFSPFQMMRPSAFYGFTGGPIAFDYGSRTVRLGLSLDEAEAKQLVPLIQAHLRRGAG